MLTNDSFIDSNLIIYYLYLTYTIYLSIFLPNLLNYYTNQLLLFYFSILQFIYLLLAFDMYSFINTNFLICLNFVPSYLLIITGSFVWMGQENLLLSFFCLSPTRPPIRLFGSNPTCTWLGRVGQSG